MSVCSLARWLGLAVAVGVAGGGAAWAATSDAHFAVVDQMAPEEVSEETDIYIDGKLLGHLHLDHATPEKSVRATVADGASDHLYALCGEITVRRPGGRTETHEVNSSGMIQDVDERTFQALGASDFTFFYLADPTPGRAPAIPSRQRSPLCHPPLS